MLDKATAAQLGKPNWIIKNLVIEGHLMAIVAEPNGGKTTILFYLASLMVDEGFDVSYIHADLSASDASYFVDKADETGISLLLPDFQVGHSMMTVVDWMTNISQSDMDLNKHVFIFDTLKKMTEVINKSQSKRLYATLRKLTSMGATIILLGHTNKYKDRDGKPIFEGTGDLRADLDELIYLHPEKHPDKSMTVSTAPDKVRGVFEPITFNIDSNRNVSISDDYINTEKSIKANNLYLKDKPIIKSIQDAIREGNINQNKIIQFCKEEGFPCNKVRKALKIYAQGNNPKWSSQRFTGENNRIEYTLLNPVNNRSRRNTNNS